MFNLNLRKFIRVLVPSFLRKAVLIAYLEVLVFSIQNIYVRLLSKRSVYAYKLSHNSQIFSIENVLNDRYDADLRRIYIEDGDRIQKVWLNTRVSNKPIWLNGNHTFPKLYLRSRESTQGVDFIIRVPSSHSIFTNSTRMQAFIQIVNYYKLFARKFKIMPF